MKQALILSALLLAGFAQAGERQDVCVSLSGLAGTYMEANQRGVPLASILDLAEHTQQHAAKDLMRGIAVGAYAVPPYRAPAFSESERLQQQNDYANAVLIDCLRFVDN